MSKPDDAVWREKYTGIIDMIGVTVMLLDAMDVKPVIKEVISGRVAG